MVVPTEQAKLQLHTLFGLPQLVTDEKVWPDGHEGAPQDVSHATCCVLVVHEKQCAVPVPQSVPQPGSAGQTDGQAGAACERLTSHTASRAENSTCVRMPSAICAQKRRGHKLRP